MKTGFGIATALVVIAAASVLGSLVAGAATDADRWWHAVVSDLRSQPLVDVALGLDQLGGGMIGVFIVPLGTGMTVLMVRGWRSALFAVAAFAASALLVQIMKVLFGRVRPEDLLVAVDFGSFPSGHTANAATIAVVLSLLFPHFAVVLSTGAWVLIMAFSRTVLAAHWLTDTLGGALLGVAAALLVAALMLAWAESDRPRIPRRIHCENSGHDDR